MEADLLVHVLDISHPNFEDHYRVVNETLLEIDKEEKTTILVFNKIDAYLSDDLEINEDDEVQSLETLKRTWMSKLNNTKCIFISAHTKENIEELREQLYFEAKEIFKVRYPYNNFLY